MRVKAPDLTQDQTREICYSVLTDAQKSRFETTKELDFSFGIRSMARFPCEPVLSKRCGVGGVSPHPVDIPELDSLGLPSVVADLTKYNAGLVLVTGTHRFGKDHHDRGDDR